MRYIIMALTLLLSFPVFSSVAEQKTVENIVVSTFNSVQSDLIKATNEDDVTAVINNHVIQHFDLNVGSRLVLGHTWRSATQEQRERFKAAFVKMLINTYSTFLVSDNVKDVTLKILRSQVGRRGRIVVNSVLTLSDGQKFKVDYLFRFNKRKSEWLVVNITVDGVSVAHSFRSEYSSVIEQNGGGRKGLEFLIQRLEGSRSN